MPMKTSSKGRNSLPTYKRWSNDLLCCDLDILPGFSGAPIINDKTVLAIVRGVVPFPNEIG
jgi:V8-like Glu-specific endopeptidase